MIPCDFEEPRVPEPLAAAGAGGGPGLDVAGGRSVLALLAGGDAVGARTITMPQVNEVGTGAGAARYAPDPRAYPLDLLEVLLGKDDPSRETGGWWCGILRSGHEVCPFVVRASGSGNSAGAIFI